MPSMSLFLFCNAVAIPKQGTETLSGPLGAHHIRSPQIYDFFRSFLLNGLYVAKGVHGGQNEVVIMFKEKVITLTLFQPKPKHCLA